LQAQFPLIDASCFGAAKLRPMYAAWLMGILVTRAVRHMNLKAGFHGVPGGEKMVVKPDGTVRHFTGADHTEEIRG
jgi:hypothetical protein